MQRQMRSCIAHGRERRPGQPTASAMIAAPKSTSQGFYKVVLRCGPGFLRLPPRSGWPGGGATLPYWMNNMPKILSGKCLCERVKYEVADDFRYALVCHCSQCRRATGSANKPFAGIEAAKLALTEGAGSVLRYGDGKNHDVRCGVCGSFLYSVVQDGETVHVA